MLWVICKFKFIIIFYYFGTPNCKMVISPGFFFFHFNILIFQVVSGVKGKKMAQKDKKFSLLHSISQELYIIWLSFWVHIFKMVISPCILIFEVVRGLKGQKMAQNDQKFYLLHSIPQELYIVWSSFMVHICKMITFPGMLFHFFKILITWVFRGLKGWLMVQNDKNFSPLCSISQEP